MGIQQLLQTVNILGILLLIVPTIWHIKCRNYVALSLFFTLYVGQLIMLINATIWGGSDWKSAWDGWGYCQFAVRFLSALEMCVMCCCIATIRSLAKILRKQGGPIRTWRTLAVEMFICWGLPICFMFLSVLVDVGPYALLQYQGCYLIIGDSWLTFVIYHLRRLILGIAALGYGCLCAYRVIKRRQDFNDILATSNTGLNSARFTRLLLHAFGVILILFPANIISFSVDVARMKFLPYSLKEYRSTLYWNSPISHFDKTVSWWIWIFLPVSFLTFIFFGTGKDALDMYATAIRKLTFQKEEIPRIPTVRRTARNKYAPEEECLPSVPKKTRRRFSWFSRHSSKSNRSANDTVMFSLTNDKSYGNLEAVESPTSTFDNDMMGNIYEVDKKV